MGFAAILLLLAACADTAEDRMRGPDGAGSYKIGKPYQVAGVWYYPKVDYDYDEIGIASWYGHPFHGRYTANGEIFDEDAISAAHTTLPLPSLVRVTNLDNDRALIVRVNDRGPFVAGRIIDLSKAAAEELGFKGNGIARVRVQIMAEESIALASAGQSTRLEESERAAAVPTTRVAAESLPPPNAADGITVGPSNAPAVPESDVASIAFPDQRPLLAREPASLARIYVQAGSFLHYANASALADRLSLMGPTLITRAEIEGQSYFRVLLGPVHDTAAANQLLARVVVSGQRDARIVVN